MKLLTALLSTSLTLSFLVAGCSNGSTATNKKVSATDTIQVYTTIFPLKDFTEKIGGSHVHVESLYPAGSDAHTFEPTQKQIVSIAKANVFIYNGVELEPFVDKMIQPLQKQNVKLVDTSKGVPLIKYNGPADEDQADAKNTPAHDMDPHIWLDPKNAIIQAENIKNVLSEIQPANKDVFEKNFEDLKSKLENLDSQFRDVVSNAKTKEVLVSHAAYGYWEHEYGIKQIPIVGLSSSDEPSQKQLAEVAKTAKDHNMKYILFESFATPKVADVVQKETGTTILRINHLATISDADAKANKNYVQLMQENINTLKTVLQ